MSVCGESSFVLLHIPAHSQWLNLVCRISPLEVALFHALFSVALIPL